SSRSTFLYSDSLLICFPTSLLPVKEIALTNGLETNSFPTSTSPLTTESEPLGSPASLNKYASTRLETGVFGEGFNTTVLAAPKAGAILCTAKSKGKLNPVIAPTTPTGSNFVKAILFSLPSIVSKGKVSPLISLTDSEVNFIVEIAL